MTASFSLSSLFILCSHGRRSAHQLFIEQDEEQQKIREGWCQGGRPVTLEDFGGEKVWWCDTHNAQRNSRAGCWKQSTFDADCQITERILIPLPQMVAGESL